MSRRATVIFYAVLFVMLVASAAYKLSQEPKTTNQGFTPSEPTQAAPELVTKQGVVGCLEPTNASGPQVMSCAAGIKQDDGTSYALADSSGSNAGSILSGKRIQVTGLLTRPATNYKSSGTIQVQSMHKP